MNENIRTFIAVHVPETVRESIGGFLSPLKRLDADVKWVRAESLHLTLKFLGDVQAERMDAVFEAVQKAAAGSTAFDAALGETGCFPNAKRPSVLWIGVRQGATELFRLAESVESALEPLGFAREKRLFLGHLTLGRVRSAKNIGRAVEAMTQTGFESGPFRVDSVHVMKSDLQRTGAQHTTLRTFKLQG